MGRQKRCAVESFKTRAWFYSIACIKGIYSPFTLERMIQPENVVMYDGKLVSSRSWDKYKAGTRTPSDSVMHNGKLGAVVAAANHVPESVGVFRHPIWTVMRSSTIQFSEAIKIISTLEPEIARYYFDSISEIKNDQVGSIFENIGLPIWIERGDYHSALYHLTVQLIFMRLEIASSFGDRRECIAENIAKTLGPISQSPGISPFFEEMFDWLELNIWGDLFNECYGPQIRNNARGWRKTIPDWLITED